MVPIPTRSGKARRVAFVVALTFAGSLIVPLGAGATVWTDQDDYEPGSVVLISGDNSNGVGYLAGETVRVEVSGPNGWTATCEGLADDAGAWSCQVTLSEGEDAAGTYTYIATGLTSTVTETGTFTDGSFQVRAKISGGGYIGIWFPGDGSGTTSTIERFGRTTPIVTDTTCSGTRYKFNGTRVPAAPGTTPTDGTYTNLTGFGTDSNNSMRLTAPSTVTSGGNTYNFSTWEVISGATRYTAATANPGCFNGFASGTNTFVQANYVLADPTPTVSSIVRAATSPTAAASVSWTVTFSEAVTGVSASNFSLVSGGAVSGASITGVSGSTTSWTVTAGTGTGSGTLGLNMTNSTGVTDSATQAVSNLPFTGEVYTIDKTLPVVVIASVSDTVLSPSETSTNITWSATDNLATTGTYAVKLGTCAAGTTITSGTNLSGSYTFGTNKITTVNVSALAYGANTVRVCVTDGVGNTGNDSRTIYRQVPTLLMYTGDTQVLSTSSFVLKGTLTDSETACNVVGKQIEFRIDLNGNWSHFDADELLGYATTVAGTNDSATATLTLTSGQIPIGVYGLRLEFAGTNECARDVDENGIIAVVNPDDAATGGGWYQIAGVTGVTKMVNFGFTTRWDKNAEAYRGQILVKNKEAWRLKGEIDAFAKTSATEGEIMGTAQLFCWNSSTQTWRLADDSVTFKAIFEDNGSAKGKGSTVKPDKFTVSRFGDYTPAAGCPAAIQPLQGNNYENLKGGNIDIK